MRLRLLPIILMFLLSGCNKAEVTYSLDFFEVNEVKIDNFQLNNINKIEEVKNDNGIRVFLFTDNDKDLIKGGIGLKDKSYYIGEVSIDNASDDLMGIEEIKVFGKRAFKIYGILGANYAHAYYWFVEEGLESIIHIDGHTVEIDLDDDGKKEIVSTLGTIPETKIYVFKEGSIYVSDIIKSIGAKSVYLLDEDKRLFDIYFEPNRPEQYVYYEGSLLKR